LHRGDREETWKLGRLFPFFLARWKDENIERLKRGECYEGEKQRAKGKQEAAADESQREKKIEEGEEKIVKINPNCEGRKRLT